MRFYTNPFVKDAPTVTQVGSSEPYFSGYTALPNGVFADYSREVTYSDGSVRRELWERRPSGFLRDAQGECFVQYDAKPPKWGTRVYYLGIVEQSQRANKR